MAVPSLGVYLPHFWWLEFQGTVHGEGLLPGFQAVVSCCAFKWQGMGREGEKNMAAGQKSGLSTEPASTL